MRIAQVAGFYHPASGGLRTAVDAVGLEYAEAGHERVLVVPGATDSITEMPWGLGVTLAAPLAPGGAGYRVVVDPGRVARVLDDLRPDRIEVSDKLVLGVAAGRWAARRAVPAVLWSHERLSAMVAPRLPCRLGPLNRAVVDRYTRFAAAPFTRIVCASRFAAAEFGAHGRAGAVALVPLGVDLTTFHPAARRARSGDGPVELVVVGRLSREKRPQLGLAVLAHLLASGVNARLTYVGSGPLRAGLERSAGDLPVVFCGHVADRPALAERLASADVVLSCGPAETFALGALEALACGTPVVGVNEGALPELVTPDVGAIAAANGPAMAGAVRSVLARPAGELRAAARRWAERFPWAATASAMLEVHQLPHRRCAA